MRKADALSIACLSAITVIGCGVTDGELKNLEGTAATTLAAAKGTGPSECSTYLGPDGKTQLTWATPGRWGTAPLNIHTGARNGFTHDQLCFIASHSEFVTIEKQHGIVTTCPGGMPGCHQSPEEGFYAAVKDLKRINPTIKVLFYFNTFQKYHDYAGYAADDPESHDDWLLHDKDGLVIYVHHGTTVPTDKGRRFPRYDFSSPGFRQWWSNFVLEVLKNSPVEVDGVFADNMGLALSGEFLRGELGKGTAGPAIEQKIDAIALGGQQLMALTKQKLHEAVLAGDLATEKLLVVNGLQGADRAAYSKLLTWAGVDGVMNEHFDVRAKTSKDDIKWDLALFRVAKEHGKFIIQKSWPGFDWTDATMMQKPQAELLALSSKALPFPLAAFLVAANRGDRFAYSWGYKADEGVLESYPLLGAKVGEALGPATWQGYRATREFACATVKVNLELKTGSVQLHACLPSPADWSLRPQLQGEDLVARSCSLYDLSSGQPPTAEGKVAYAYCLMLGRTAEPLALQTFGPMLSQGKFTIDHLVETMASWPEFQARYETATLSNLDFVGLLYRMLLLRHGDEAHVGAFAARVDSGQTTRAQLVTGFVEASLEFDVKHPFLQTP